MAVGKEEEIQKAWKFVEANIACNISTSLSRTDNIEYALGKFRSLALDEQLHTLPPEAQSTSPIQRVVDINMDGDEYDARFYWESGDLSIVERDLLDLAREEPFFATNQLANLNLLTSNTKLPKKLDIPTSEILVGVYACSLWTSGSLPRLGQLYLTPNFVAFYSGAMLVFSALPLSIRFTDIVHVQYFVQTGIEVIQLICKQDPSKTSAPSKSSSTSSKSNLSGFHTMAFAAMTGGIQIFEEVNKLWKLSMKKFQAGESDKKRIREGEKKDEYLVTYEEAMKAQQEAKETLNSVAKIVPSPISSPLPSSTPSTSNTSRTKGNSSEKRNAIPVARSALQTLTAKVLKKFRLPDTEQLLTQARASVTVYAKRGHSFVKSSNEVVSVEGVAFMTTHFLCFLDLAQYKSCPLGQQAAEVAGKSTTSAFQTGDKNGTGVNNEEEALNDDVQSANVLLAEWDVAAAEDEDSPNMDDAQRQRQAQLIKQAKKNVPATSLATSEDAPSRLWLVIPLREVSKLKVGKPSTSVSTAYSEFGVTPYIVNVHLPYNMYSLTFINRPNIFECMAKVHARVQRQEAHRIPLYTYSLDLNPSAPALASSSGSTSSTPPSNVTPPINISGSKTPQQTTSPSISPQPSSSIPTITIDGQSTSPNSNSTTRAPLLGSVGSSFSSSSITIMDGSASPSPSSSSQPPPRDLFFKHVTQHPLSSGDAKFPESILSDSKQFASTYRARERLQEEKFLNYFHRYGQSVGMCRKGPELPILIRDGIPHSLRGHLWFTISGASNRMMTAPNGYYQSILESHGGKPSTAVEQIERDLHRSMPSHPFYSLQRESTPPKQSGDGYDPFAVLTEVPYEPCKGNAFYHPLSPPSNEPVGISRLRRVLVAYSWHNPVIAYCQSMNIVVAMLLLYMSEEEAFFTLITLVEYLEEYWTREMLGAIVDMLVLKDVLKQKKFALVAHLESLELDYSIAALPWFMCLFIGYVPHQLALRLMDCFFYNAGLGKATSTLFQAAIALFTIAEQDLMNAYDPIAVSTVLRAAPYGFDCDKLISLVFSDDALSLRSTIIDELRNFHRYNAIQNIEAQNMEEEFMVLVYGKKMPISIPASRPTSLTSSGHQQTSASVSSSSTSSTASSTTESSAKLEAGPAPPPTTPVHFQLSDLKRLYIDFKDKVLSHPELSTERIHQQEKASVANSKSIIASLSASVFPSLFQRHLSWWPSYASSLLPLVFKWMDVSRTGGLSFVEYVQGLDVLSFGKAPVLTEFFYDLLLPSPTSQGLDQVLFSQAVRLIYYALLYSKATPEAEESPSTTPVASPSTSAAAGSTSPVPATTMKPIVARKRLHLEAVSASESLDDWLLLNADEKFDEVLAPAMLDTIFASYEENGIISRERFLISVSNQLVLIPPATLQDV